MNDEELASKCVGIINVWDGLPKGVSASEFVRDWRVAGALMDKLPHPIGISSVDNAVWVEITIYSPNGDEEADPIRIVAHQENQPRAIIEACVAAL